MEWLNYHHLLYFWSVAKHGTIANACAELRLAQPTISAQIRTLEDALGERLFTRAGRHLALTEVGRVVFKYAEEIFSLGHDLMNTVTGRSTAMEQRICRQYHVQVVGRLAAVTQRLYAIAVERRLKHPAVPAIIDNPRHAILT
jgi:DNA-binding transcriptional LysR family regulator